MELIGRRDSLNSIKADILDLYARLKAVDVARTWATKQTFPSGSPNYPVFRGSVSSAVDNAFGMLDTDNTQELGVHSSGTGYCTLRAGTVLTNEDSVAYSYSFDNSMYTGSFVATLVPITAPEGFYLLNVLMYTEAGDASIAEFRACLYGIAAYTHKTNLAAPDYIIQTLTTTNGPTVRTATQLVWVAGGVPLYVRSVRAAGDVPPNLTYFKYRATYLGD